MALKRFAVLASALAGTAFFAAAYAEYNQWYLLAGIGALGLALYLYLKGKD